ncbi:MAG: hypothetical protein V2B20_01765 [Pseudomonadota bacterium]
MIWVIIACIVPDLPWIVLKVLLALHFFNPYNLRLYCTAQASLLFCLFFSAGLACFTGQSRRIFIVLASNCLLHLVLDTIETKWGNGVNIIAPFSWTLLHKGVFWPEHPLILAFTVIGFLSVLRNWQGCISSSIPLQSDGRIKPFVGILFLCLYMLGPIFFLNQLERANTYNIHTLRMKDQRPGKPIEFDRVHYFAKQHILETFAGEQLTVIGSQPAKSGRVSFSGHFLTPTSFTSSKYHYHLDQRDLASLLGLFMACTLLLQSLILPRFQQNKKNQGPP